MTKKIGLDAGHGLYTAGKQTPTGVKEWTLNDKIADKITAFLKDYEVEVIRTDNNEGNVDEADEKRRDTYLDADVDVFVSIHHNAFTGTWNTATGVEVWVDRNATSEDMKLANCIYPKLVANTGLCGRGIKKENWTVIYQNKIPAVLCEGGFMDSSNDYKIITSEAGQTAYARAVADGLVEFLGLKKKEKTEVGKMYKVQVGAFSVKANAEKLLAKLKADGYQGFIVEVGETKEEVKPVEPVKTIKVGSTVKVKKGAKTYEGGGLADFVYNRNHTAKEINGDRVVIAYDNTVVCAIHKDNLILV